MPSVDRKKSRDPETPRHDGGIDISHSQICIYGVTPIEDGANSLSTLVFLSFLNCMHILLDALNGFTFQRAPNLLQSMESIGKFFRLVSSFSFLRVTHFLASIPDALQSIECFHFHKESSDQMGSLPSMTSSASSQRLEHLGKARPKRTKTHAPSRPSILTTDEHAQEIGEGLESFFKRRSTFSSTPDSLSSLSPCEESVSEASSYQSNKDAFKMQTEKMHRTDAKRKSAE